MSEEATAADFVESLLSDPRGAVLLTALWRLRRENEYENDRHLAIQIMAKANDWPVLLATARDEVIMRALDHFDNNQGHAAQALHCSRYTVMRAAKRMRQVLLTEGGKHNAAMALNPTGGDAGRAAGHADAHRADQGD